RAPQGGGQTVPPLPYGAVGKPCRSAVVGSTGGESMALQMPLAQFVSISISERGSHDSEDIPRLLVPRRVPGERTESSLVRAEVANGGGDRRTDGGPLGREPLCGVAPLQAQKIECQNSVGQLGPCAPAREGTRAFVSSSN